jgi:hypothetical protein
MNIPSVVDVLSGKMTTFQITTTYRILANSFWTGVAFTTGIIKNKLDLAVHVNLNETASSGALTGHLVGSFDLNTYSEVTTIPIFISTGITPFDWINLYTSIGGNYAKGHSTVSALLEAEVTYDGSTGISDAHYSLNGNYNSEFAFNFMFLAGANFLLFNHFNLGLQYAKMSNDSSLGLNFSFPL